MATFAEIIDGFFRIKLKAQDLVLLDSHFLAANHHCNMSRIAASEEERVFHNGMFLENVRRLAALISTGDFSDANIENNAIRVLRLHTKEGWYARVPAKDVDSFLPIDALCQQYIYDPKIFGDSGAGVDIRFGVGEFHPYDELLDNPKILPQNISLEISDLAA